MQLMVAELNNAETFPLAQKFHRAALLSTMDVSNLQVTEIIANMKKLHRRP